MRARESLTEFVNQIDIPGVPVSDDEDCETFYPDRVEPAEHHALMIDVLERVARGEIKRVMFFLPPGSAKSTYASVVFPPWFMGNNPGKNIIAVSYGADLARKFGRKCRAIVRSGTYERIFGAGLTGDNSAVDDWSLDNGSTYMTGGILSGITGNRADGIVVDDPVKGREDADSEVIRDKTWDAYVDDVKTRLKPGGWIFIVQTRWHEDDLSGRILPEDYAGQSGWVTARDGEQWYVVNVPAQAEREDDPLGRRNGEWLWTEWWSVEEWEQTKRSATLRSLRTWNALYQQRPAPEDGDYFRREWIRTYDVPPAAATMRVYGASDYAVTAGGGDYTVHVVVGVDPEDRMYLLDLWRGQTDSAEWVESFCDLTIRHKPIEWAEETGQIKSGVGPFLLKRQSERKAYVYRRAFPTRGDKAVRAQAIRGRMALKGLYVPKDAPWRVDFERELMAFPAASHDDQVDALGLVGQLLDHIDTGKPEKQKDDKPVYTLQQPIKKLMRPSNSSKPKYGTI